ncbi:MAG: trans-sulfuration enzyme family protein [Chloroflexota bacterium]
MSDRHGFATRCLHAGEAPDPSTGAHGVPMYGNVTYAFRSFEQIEAMAEGRAPHFTYSPRGNPTVRSLELKMADLEGAERSIAAASGMAAIAPTLVSLARDGGHIVAAKQVYHLSGDILDRLLPSFGASATRVDLSDEAAVRAAIGEQTRAIYAEPVSNPSLEVADLPMLSAIARDAGIPLVVDNTFLSPALLRPIELGADLVIHSATKYLSGLGQVQGGFVSGPAARLDAIREQMIVFGGQMPPFSGWLLLQGMKTLPMRMRTHCDNAARLAALLAAHPAVASVHYPGLAGHPGHAVAARDLASGFGGMISFSLHGGRSPKAAFLNALELATLAVSLGDVTTLVWPWSDIDLIRVSVGVEDGDDLERDFRRGLDAALAALSPDLAPAAAAV